MNDGMEVRKCVVEQSLSIRKSLKLNYCGLHSGSNGRI